MKMVGCCNVNAYCLNDCYSACAFIRSLILEVSDTAVAWYDMRTGILLLVIWNKSKALLFLILWQYIYKNDKVMPKIFSL